MGVGLIGDIIWCQSIAQNFIEQGHSVVWPVASHYYEGCRFAYPDIDFVPDRIVRQELFNVKEKKEIDGMMIAPIRWSDSYMKVPYKYVMKSKFDMYDLDWKIWRNHAMWERDMNKERNLMKLLGINGTPFNFINKRFGTNAERSVEIEVKNDYRNIEMSEIEGYSLFDWTGVLLSAAEIHTVSTSLLFMMEVLPITSPIHLYCRKPIEKDFSFVDYIFTKPYIIHN